MSITDDHAVTLQRSRRRRDEQDYRWVFWAAFPFFLVTTLVSRLMPGSRPSARTGGTRQTVFREAWVAANSSIPFAFMN